MDAPVPLSSCRAVSFRKRAADESRQLFRKKILSIVEANPIIWDKIFKDTNAKAKKWQEIAVQLNTTPGRAKRTWENLRDQYRRDLKRWCLEKIEPRWHLFHRMDFLRKMIRFKKYPNYRGSIRGSVYNDDDNDDDDDDDEDDDGAKRDDETAEKYQQSSASSSHANPRHMDVQTAEQNAIGENQNNSREQSPKPPPSPQQHLQQHFDEPFEEITNDHQLTSMDAHMEQLSHNDIKLEMESDWTEATSVSRTSLSPKYRKMRLQRKSSSRSLSEHDEDYHFVMSILPSLRRIHTNRKFQMRTKIMLAISTELEMSGAATGDHGDC